MSENAPEANAGPAPEKKEALSDEQWAEIRAAYELGTAGAKELAEKYDVSPQALYKHFQKHGVVRNSRKGELEKKVAEEAAKKTAAAVATNVAAAASVSFASKRKQRIEETKEAVYTSAAALGVLSSRILKESATPGAAVISTRHADIKALKTLSEVIANTMEMRYRVLNADEDVDEAGLPALPIMDLTEDDIAAIHAGHNDDDLVLPEPALEDDDVVEL